MLALLPRPHTVHPNTEWLPLPIGPSTSTVRQVMICGQDGGMQTKTEPFNPRTMPSRLRVGLRTC
jgi:hypothetical protein